jgi:hypothetical protein
VFFTFIRLIFYLNCYDKQHKKGVYRMKMADIRQKAAGLGLKTSRIKKSDLIKAVQSEEGNFPCFQMATDYCDQNSCCWRSDCLPNKKGN